MLRIIQDLHIHTNISKCGKPEATVENCLAAAEQQGLKKIGFANHCWAKEIAGKNQWYQGQDIEHVLKIKEQLPANIDMQIYIGCETEYTGKGITGLNKELAGCFDFVLIPANHFHQKGFVVPADLGSAGPKAVAELLYKRFMETTELGFGDVIAHPFIPLGFLDWEAIILKSISTSQYENCFKSAASAGLSIEIQRDVIRTNICLNEAGFSSLYLSIFTIARECGCKFTFASDAHHPDEITGYTKLAQFAEACGIDETMLFFYERQLF